MITGGIKFFDSNIADGSSGPTVTSSTGQSTANFILDKNNYTVWKSSGSSDVITETLDILLNYTEYFSRILLKGHNFKRYKIEYWNGSAYVNLPVTYTINGDQPGDASELTYSYNTSYYEFTSILTNRIKITIYTTQIANEEKYLNQLIICNEIGTLLGYPEISMNTKDKNLKKSEMLNGRQKVTKGIETFRASINFKNYPPSLTSDIDTIYTLFDRDDPFYIWLCGGRAGTTYFKYTLRGFRLQDVVLVQTTNVFEDTYSKNIYTAGINLKAKFEESV